jgi:uncharacterized protein (DUF1330 family)
MAVASTTCRPCRHFDNGDFREETMVAYVIADFDVTNAALFEEYRKQGPQSIAAYGGRYLARGGAIEALEGDWAPSRIVVLEFASRERAKEWINSTEYAAARRLRQQAASSDMIVVEGLPPP